jgi:hypothetical protein
MLSQLQEQLLLASPTGPPRAAASGSGVAAAALVVVVAAQPRLKQRRMQLQLQQLPARRFWLVAAYRTCPCSSRAARTGSQL